MKLNKISIKLEMLKEQARISGEILLYCCWLCSQKVFVYEGII